MFSFKLLKEQLNNKTNIFKSSVFLRNRNDIDLRICNVSLNPNGGIYYLLVF